MSKESCVTYPANSIFLMVRDPLISICKLPMDNEAVGKKSAPDPQAAAIILHKFIYWTDGKMDLQHQTRYKDAAAASAGEVNQEDNGLWIYKDYDELKLDLLDLFGRNKIIDNVQWLVAAGYLKRRTNPRYRWDKTLQYLVDIDLVQSQIDALPKFKIKLSIVPNQTIETGKNKRAIPKKTTKKEEETTLPAAIADRAGTHSHTPSLADEADDKAMFKNSARAGNALPASKPMREAQTPSPSLKQKPSTAEYTTPHPPIAAAPPAPEMTETPANLTGVDEDAPVKKTESAAQAAQRIKVESLVACGFVEPTTTRGWSNFKGVIKTLTEAGITAEMYAGFVKWVKAEASSQSGWTVTLNSLAEKMRPERYIAQRPKNAISGDSSNGQVPSIQTGAKRVYSRENDPTYAHLYANPEQVKQAK
jgi:hypothetical protein